jgi:DNA repair exonuclease SbcCD ATPase subunit
MLRAWIIAALLVAAALPPVAAHAQAQSEVDRLRDALRNLTIQMRTLEDQRAAIQARLAEADRERQRANELAEDLKKQVKEAQDALQDGIREFNQRLTERDETLEKWKTAYEQAADVAREQAAQRAKFETESTTYKARTRSCESRNAELLKVSNEILASYRDLNPVTADGIGRIEHQNRVQDFRDRILDKDAKLPPVCPPPDQKTPDQKPQDQKPQDQKPAGGNAPGQKSADSSAKNQPGGDRKSRRSPGQEGAKP